MRHRINGNVHLGIGNPAPEELNNEWTDNENFNKAARAFFDDVLKSVKVFNEIGGFDFSMILRNNGFRITFGLEPAYQGDLYICYCFDSNKDDIYIRKGQANGYCGSDVIVNEELNYREGMCEPEFKACIERHYDELMKCIAE